MEEQLLFVYMAYGGWQFRRQAVLSILSLLQYGPLPGKILVYTDRPGEFKELPVEAVFLDKPTIKNWRGPYGYIHRMKIELLDSLFKKNRRHVVFVDSDTIWTRSPAGIYESLDNARAVMHVCENQLSDRFFPQYRTVLEKAELIKDAGLPFVPMEQFWVYNSGVLGLPSTLNPALINEALRICDLICRNAPFTMEWVEQVGFSYILQGHGVRIDTCGEDVLHYWPDSFEFGRRLKKCSFTDLADLGKDPERIRELLKEARKGKRSFVNQLLVRTKRLGRSMRKRKRESLVFLEKLRSKILVRARREQEKKRHTKEGAD